MKDQSVPAPAIPIPPTEGNPEGSRTVTVKFNSYGYRLLEAMAQYDGCNTVEECILEAVAEAIGAWGEGISQDEWKELFLNGLVKQRKEVAP